MKTGKLYQSNCYNPPLPVKENNSNKSYSAKENRECQRSFGMFSVDEVVIIIT